MMRFQVIVCVMFIAALSIGSGCSESGSQSPEEDQAQRLDSAQAPPDPEPATQSEIDLSQHGVVISSGLYDTTDRWRKRFGLDGKLHIEDGRRDGRPTYADGPVELSFNATPSEPGIYTFVFVLVQHNGLPSQIHAVHLYVKDGHHNETPMTITPGQHGTMWKRTVATGQPVEVYWAGDGGHRSLGAPIGWRLSEVVYTQSTEPFQPPGIPRYEYIGGE